MHSGIQTQLKSLPKKIRPNKASAAVDRQTGEVFLGTNAERTVRPADLESRLPDPSLEAWTAANCAEVAACASAVGNGSAISNLDIYTARVNSGARAEPYDNCASWVPSSRG